MRKIKTTKIGQKDYVDVSERIMSFWELHPDWAILTSIEQVDLETGVVIIKAWVEDEKGKVRSTGHAHEFQADKKSKVNMTSFVENCETSAIGRALGTKGIGTEYGIASAFEVQNAKDKEAEMKEVQLKNYKDKADEVDPPKGGEQKIVLELDDVVEKPDNDLLTKDATQEMRNGIVGKKVNTTGSAKPLPEVINADSETPEEIEEKEEKYLVDLNRRVSTLKNAKDAKALAEEGREWSDNWTYKKDVYKTLYGCIKESFAAFKRSEDNAESANLKGGS